MSLRRYTQRSEPVSTRNFHSRRPLRTQSQGLPPHHVDTGAPRGLRKVQGEDGKLSQFLRSLAPDMPDYLLRSIWSSWLPSHVRAVLTGQPKGDFETAVHCAGHQYRHTSQQPPRWIPGPLPARWSSAHSGRRHTYHNTINLKRLAVVLIDWTSLMMEFWCQNRLGHQLFKLSK
jgi:hypothetical protein